MASGFTKTFSIGASGSKSSMMLDLLHLEGMGSSEWWAGRGGEKK